MWDQEPVNLRTRGEVSDGSNVKGKAAEENIFICMCVNVTMDKRVRKTHIILLGGPRPL